MATAGGGAGGDQEWGDEDWDDDDVDFEALEDLEKRALQQRNETAAPPRPGPPAAPPHYSHPPGHAPQQTAQPPRHVPPLPPAPPPAPPPRREDPAAALCRRVHLFKAERPPPPQPPYNACPGVFGRGCGGGLRLVQWAEGAACFWACSTAPECAYREFLPLRKRAPELAIQLDRQHGALRVGPAPGADDAVAWCGGTAAVLTAAGVDLRRALHVPAPPPAPGAEAAGVGASVSTAPPPASEASGPPPAATAGEPVSAATAVAPQTMSAAPAPPSATPAPAEAAQATAAGEMVAEVAKMPAREGTVAAPDNAAASGDAAQLPANMAAQQPAAVTEQQQAAALAEQPVPAERQAAAEGAAPLPAGGAAQRAAPSPAPPEPAIFPLHEYERLSAQLQQFGRQHDVCLLAQAGMIPPATLKAAKGTLRTLPPPDAAAQRYARMPRFLEAALLPFQREGVRFGLARNGRCLIADEMGVGKTVQAVALASCYQEEWPLLVIAPASLRLVWAEEIEKWLPHLRPSCIHVIEGKEDRVARDSLPLVCITSYEMMQRLTCDACKGRGVQQQASMCAGQRPPCRDPHHCMACLQWRVVVVDESHTLRTSSKPPDALHTEAVVSAVKAARRAILLTGTPSLSRPFDLFRQVDAIMPGLLGRSRIEFAVAYCNRREVPLPGFHAPGQRGMRWDVSGLSRGAELHDLLKAEVMLRRLKRNVLSQLPPKRRQVIRLPKPPPSEWPKLAPGRRQHAGDSDSSASSGEEQDEAAEGAGAGGDGSGGAGAGRPQYTSAAHRTGVAKCSAVIEWLMTALGVRGGLQGGGRRRGAGAGGDDDDGASGDGGASGGGASEGGPKLLVFAHHKTVMNRLAAALEGAVGYAPVGYVRIDGGTDPEDRRAAVRRFSSDAAIRVALLSVAAAGVGLDFSAASVVVFAELPDEVALVRQAEDRAHRQGQRHPVNIYFLCAKGTTDDRRWQALNRSLARVSAVQDGAGLQAPPAGPAAGQGAGQAGEAGGVGDAGAWRHAAAAGEEQQGTAVAAQAGLLVECVHDAEEAGLTPGATRACRQAKLSPLPAAAAPAAAPAAEPAVAAAAGTPAAGASMGGAAAAAATAAAAQHALPAEPVEVWFEVSGNTGRVHLHRAPDGSAPLRLNLPLETLLAGDSPALEELLAAVDQGAEAAPPAQQQQQQHTEPDGQQQQQQQLAAQQQQDIQRRLAGGGAEQPPPPTQHQQAQKLQTARPVVIGGIGVLAVDRQRSAGQLAVMLAEAKEFAAEWRELRGLHQSRLQGRVLRAPLNEAVEEADAAAAAGGQLGTSKSRFVDAQQRADLALPPRAQWHAVRVAFKRYGRETTYQQPFLPDGARLCINCAKAVPGKAAAQPPEALLDGMTLLFCGGECERRFGLKSNGSAYRRAVFKLERGVCVACKLDCHKLVKRLQAVEKGSRGWEEQRRRIIAARAPRLMARGYKAYLDVLVRRAVEGNAWQADHVVPVYKGGGLCDVDNLRTLCVACHADVTKEQAKERAATKRQGKAGGGGGGPGWEDVEAAGAGQPVLKRRKKLQRKYISDSEDGEAWPAPAAAAAPAAGAAAAAGAVAGAAAGAAAAGKPAMKRRKQLQRMYVSDSEEAEVPAAAAPAGAAAAAAAKAPHAGKHAAGSAATAAAAGSGQPAPRRQKRLKPLFADEADGEGCAVLGAVGGQPGAGQPAAQAQHRLARSSTAGEQPAAAGTASPAAGGDSPLQENSNSGNAVGGAPRLGAAEQHAGDGSQGGGAAPAKDMSGTGGKPCASGDSGSSKPGVEMRRAQPAARAMVDDGER